MKITKKMELDVETMAYFYPKSAPRRYIKKSDREAMAIYSATGKKPAVTTKGFEQLMWGKTYRDMQITAWSEDIRQGYITKWEIYSSLPKSLRAWAEKKLVNVPYDEDAYENIGTEDEPNFVPTGRGSRPMFLKWSKK